MSSQAESEEKLIKPFHRCVIAQKSVSARVKINGQQMLNICKAGAEDLLGYKRDGVEILLSSHLNECHILEWDMNREKRVSFVA